MLLLLLLLLLLPPTCNMLNKPTPLLLAVLVLLHPTPWSHLLPWCHVRCRSLLVLLWQATCSIM
jgi:hypothetical protein